MPSRIIILTLFSLLALSSTPAVAKEPNWSGVVVARGQQRVKIQSTEIVRRPYRPLHFYGNTVRRRHYRGRAIPLPRDFSQGMIAFLSR